MFYSVHEGKNVCGIANSILANAVLLVTSFPRHFFCFLCLNVGIILCVINVSKNKEGGRLVILSIVSSDFLFYYMSCNFLSLLVCSVFSKLVNVCKHFILFTLEVDASEREPFNVKLYAESLCKHDRSPSYLKNRFSIKGNRWLSVEKTDSHPKGKIRCNPLYWIHFWKSLEILCVDTRFC